MFNEYIILITLFTVVFAERDYDGTYNYCFEADHSHGQIEYTISYNSIKALKLKEGQQFKAEMELQCDYGDAMDEVLTEKLGRWMPYKKYICDAIKVEFK